MWLWFSFLGCVEAKERGTFLDQRAPIGLQSYPDAFFGPQPEGPLQGSVKDLDDQGVKYQPGAITQVAIIASDLGFFPRVIMAWKGLPVRLFVTSASRQPLCLMVEPFSIRKQLRAIKVEEFEFTPQEVGTIRMHCPINGMEATLVVREPPDGAPLRVPGGSGI
jgi:hypothetical protein